MSLRLIYGRSGSGKTFFCLEDIKKKLAEEKETSLVLIVPEQFSMQAEKNLIKTVGDQGLRSAEVLSFKRMAYRVFNEVGGVARQYINLSGKSMLLYSIVNEYKNKLKLFNKSVNRKGFIKVRANTICELKRYNISPEKLLDISERIDCSDQLKYKLEDIHIIYEHFEKEMYNKYIDAEDELTIFAEKLEQSVKFNNAIVWIDEFSGFTPQEYKIIEKLMLKCKQVNITLCSDCEVSKDYIDTGEVFSPVKKTAQRLISIAARNNIDIEDSIVLNNEPLYRYRQNAELMHLESNFFAFPHLPYQNIPENICVFSASNIYTEVENTAKDIIRKVRDKGLRYKEIAVAVRNLSEYEKLIKVIFKQYDIPCFIDRKKDISSHPLILLILSALDIIINNWSYSSVFSYLKTGLTGIPLKNIDIIENYVLAAGIKGKYWTSDERWNYRIFSYWGEDIVSAYEAEIIEKVNSIRQEIVAPLIFLQENLKNGQTVKELCTALYEFLCRLEVPERIEKFTEMLKKESELNVAGEYAQIWNIIVETIDQLVEVLGNQKFSLRKFREILAIGFSEHSIGLIPPALDQVIVGSIERSKRRDIQAMYILGVNDGILPAVVIDEGIISDEDRAILGEIGMELAQDTKTRSFEEQFLIYSAITATKRYLWFSYPIADHEGRSMRPSIIISRLKKIFPNIIEKSNIIEKGFVEDNIEYICLPGPTFNTLISAVRENIEGGRDGSLWSDVYEWFKCNEDWSIKCSEVMSGLNYTNFISKVDAAKIRELFRTPLYSSISRIEKYAACPFSYFIQYGLNVRDRKVWQMNPPDMGTIIHGILNEFSIYIHKNNINWRNVDTSVSEKIVDDIVGKIEKKSLNMMPGLSFREKFILMRLKRIALKSISIITEQVKSGEFEPEEFEVEFGDDGKYPPIKISLSSGEEMRIVGRIDRIDKCKTDKGTYLRIIDYKSGYKEFRLSDLYYGLQIQLAVYMDAIYTDSAIHGAEKIIPGGIMYFKVDDPIINVKNKRQITDDEKVKKEILKRMKLKGLLLNDIDAIKNMDKSIDGYSYIIPAGLNTNGEISKTSSVVSYEELMRLRKYIRKLLIKQGDKLFEGNIAIAPYKNQKNTACDHCNYAGVCQFDTAIKNNRFRALKDLKDYEVWKLINEQIQEEGDNER